MNVKSVNIIQENLLILPKPHNKFVNNKHELNKTRNYEMFCEMDKARAKTFALQYIPLKRNLLKLILKYSNIMLLVAKKG